MNLFKKLSLKNTIWFLHETKCFLILFSIKLILLSLLNFYDNLKYYKSELFINFQPNESRVSDNNVTSFSKCWIKNKIFNYQGSWQRSRRHESHLFESVYINEIYKLCYFCVWDLTFSRLRLESDTLHKKISSTLFKVSDIRLDQSRFFCVSDVRKLYASHLRREMILWND